MPKELLSPKKNTLIVELEKTNTLLENLAGMASNVDVRPLVGLVRNFESKPNLALSLVFSGIGVKVEGNEILIANPDIVANIVAATNEPLSEELVIATTELITDSLKKMITYIRQNKRYDPDSDFDLRDKLTAGDYISLMRKQQPEVSQIVAEYIQDPRGDLITLEQILKNLKGEPAEVKPQKEQLLYKEPDKILVDQIKNLCQELGFQMLELNSGFSGIEIVFNKGMSAFSQRETDNSKIFELAIKITKDFIAYCQWKFQNKLTVDVGVDDNKNKVEIDFYVKGANKSFAQLKKEYFGGLKLVIVPADFWQRSSQRGTIINPNSRIGTLGGYDESRQWKFMEEYLQRFGN